MLITFGRLVEVVTMIPKHNVESSKSIMAIYRSVQVATSARLQLICGCLEDSFFRFLNWCLFTNLWQLQSKQVQETAAHLRTCWLCYAMIGAGSWEHHKIIREGQYSVHLQYKCLFKFWDLGIGIIWAVCREHIFLSSDTFFFLILRIRNLSSNTILNLRILVTFFYHRRVHEVTRWE